jgi:hypothetical protein
MINGRELDNRNLEVSHQHIFHDDYDKYSEGNVGYGDRGVFQEIAADGGPMTLDYRENGYVCEPAYYDDAIIAQAVNNLRNFGNWTADRYNFIKNNCQDFVSEVLEEYYRLGGPAPENRPFPEFDLPRYLHYLQSLPPSVPPGFGLMP